MLPPTQKWKKKKLSFSNSTDLYIEINIYLLNTKYCVSKINNSIASIVNNTCCKIKKFKFKQNLLSIIINIYLSSSTTQKLLVG